MTCYYVGGSVGAVLPGFLWRVWGWPGCVAAIALMQALTVGMALTLWEPTHHGAQTAEAGGA